MSANGDTDKPFLVSGKEVRGIGSFHKTLPRANAYGEVDDKAFKALVKATRGDDPDAFSQLPGSPAAGGFTAAQLVNPQAGLAEDRLTDHPCRYRMSPAPHVLSKSTAAEMLEVYWMALLRDEGFDNFGKSPLAVTAIKELKKRFEEARNETDCPGRLVTGVDLPGARNAPVNIRASNLFRVGLPGEEVGPLVSQFFLRNAQFGTQSINQMQLPYKEKLNFIYSYKDWFNAQSYGRGADLQNYNGANEMKPGYFESQPRFIATPRDLARFVHKDALHQAYFNATILMLSGKLKWTRGNPYNNDGRRDGGFGTLGGPNILSLVSEVATRALKVVWHQKWQTHLRLRPEAYAGLVHMEQIGHGGVKRPYGLPVWIGASDAAAEIRKGNKAGWGGMPGAETYFLPMAFTSGSPAHPAYGAGHATVAGACVTVLKAFFDMVDNMGKPRPITDLVEGEFPFSPKKKWVPLTNSPTAAKPFPYTGADKNKLTIEGELNKLAANVAMGRSMGGVHWRTDNTRSLMLGEAVAAQILADITRDVAEDVAFEFRTFGRKANGDPKEVKIHRGGVFVDNKIVRPGSML